MRGCRLVKIGYKLAKVRSEGLKTLGGREGGVSLHMAGEKLRKR